MGRCRGREWRRERLWIWDSRVYTYLHVMWFGAWMGRIWEIRSEKFSSLLLFLQATVVLGQRRTATRRYSVCPMHVHSEPHVFYLSRR